ncbi:MAG: hypothetical protein SOR89_06360 [Ndongobacter sp.]|nr:hypothetical protein [Ndongobacter sp.]
MIYRLAEIKDCEGIKALLRKYHKDTISDEERPDGFVTTAITDEQLTMLIEQEHGVTVSLALTNAYRSKAETCKHAVG